MMSCLYSNVQTIQSSPAVFYYFRTARSGEEEWLVIKPGDKLNRLLGLGEIMKDPRLYSELCEFKRQQTEKHFNSIREPLPSSNPYSREASVSLQSQSNSN